MTSSPAGSPCSSTVARTQSRSPPSSRKASTLGWSISAKRRWRRRPLPARRRVFIFSQNWSVNLQPGLSRATSTCQSKLGIQPLCESAFGDIKSKVSADNVVDEVFSLVTARWVLPVSSTVESMALSSYARKVIMKSWRCNAIF
jgi:hypothetical protein